ncbi:MAG: hypothetical protein QOG64_1822 [Acidimicrobiaceae bacterium]|nr:hypothetical protein [Acidimicrobiaceae bacterium]
MDEIAIILADTVDAALPGWVARSVERVLAEQGRRFDDALRAEAGVAGQRALDDVGPRLRALLAADIDEQRSTPLTLLRDAARYPTEVLRSAGAAPVERDEFDRSAFPDDDYGLAPATFADIDPVLIEPALAWGAAKAFEHKARHKS